jgi:hypothetical protein
MLLDAADVLLQGARIHLGYGERPFLQAGKEIELAVEMAVGGEDIFHLERLTIGILLGMLHALEGIFGLSIGFEHADGQGFRHLAHLHADLDSRCDLPLTMAAFWAGWFDRDRGFHLEPLVIVVPLVTQYGIDQKNRVSCSLKLMIFPPPLVSRDQSPSFHKKL